ncbi:hypothetical protein, partial [Kiloniella majae]|uniref:hypothetical protein n=1 Tax=Kiloniella majae TaxID=1938558 RepID=UPI001C3F74BE
TVEASAPSVSGVIGPYTNTVKDLFAFYLLFSIILPFVCDNCAVNPAEKGDFLKKQNRVNIDRNP